MVGLILLPAAHLAWLGHGPDGCAGAVEARQQAERAISPLDKEAWHGLPGTG
jgi:hypothetical protein